MQSEREQLARNAQRNLQSALCAWYSWLSDQSRHSDDWKSVPWWCKNAPGRLDLRWALDDLPKYVDHEQMMRVLFVVVDELHLSGAEMGDLPDLGELRGVLLEICEGFDE